jgi:ParB family transcriptional regulator, chromosome partitioning protein
MGFDVIQVSTDEIKFFVRRARGETAYARLKESIKEVGLKTPIGVRELGPKSLGKGKRGTASQKRFELVYGQGRLQAFRELGIPNIPAVIVDVPEEEIVGRFLAENMMRRKLSWRDKARLIQSDIEENGLSLDEVAARYCITQSHARKYLRVSRDASPKALERADQGAFDMSTAEKLTTLAKEDQDIVIDVMDDRQLDKSAIMHLVDEAARLRNRNGHISKDSLRESIDDINVELRRLRDRYKIKRLEYGLGPQNLFRLCEDVEFVARMKQHGIEVSHFIHN